MTIMALEKSVQRESEETVKATAATASTVNRTKRGQRLRAVNWVKQIRNELIAAEFALSLVTPFGRVITKGGLGDAGGEMGGRGGTEEEGMAKGKGKGGIDYDSIAERLEESLRTLQAGRPMALLDAISQEELEEISDRLKSNITKLRKVVQADGRGVAGGGDSAATSAPATGAKEESAQAGEEGGSWIVDGMKSKINVDLKDVKVPEFDLFLRDDGTVDWDGAIQSGREVARFGQELWDRINGQNPHDEGGVGGHGGADKTPRDLPEDSEQMLLLSSAGAALSAQVDQLQKDVDALKADARAKEKTWTGLDRRNAQREIRANEKPLANARRQMRLHSIDVDMERVCYIIEQDIRESTKSASSENRLLVAEFGLLDAQLANLKRIVLEMTKVEEGARLHGEAAVDIDDLALDEDELELVSREVVDLKNRLGMDLENPAFTVDPEKVTRYVKETYEKIRSGVDFYWTGTKVLGNDVGYALSLVIKAAQGSILKPREVRTIRRTAKDCVTFIPFVIILILPLTPVGHVLVFSFIQRFFPDFFPSTYTDRRQNLLKMYTEVEKKGDDWGEESDTDGEGDDILDKLRRNFTSTLSQVGDQGKDVEKHKGR